MKNRPLLKLLAVFLSVIIGVCSIPAFSFSVSADSGKCGDNLTWEYNSSTYTLTISGTGDMYNYNSNSSPWYSYRANIKTVNIGNSVTSIGDYAFSSCYGLTSITIPNSVTNIGSSAFYYCYELTSIEIPNSVTSIGSWAFAICRGLTSVTIGNGVTSIGEYAFYGCYGLKSIEIPNSVTSIGKCAFEGCTRLTSIEIPNSVTSIGNYAFSDCYGLTSITVDSNNAKYYSEGNCIIEKSTNTLICGCKNSIISNSVTSIGEGVFFGCYGLKSIEIPNSVTSIGRQAFSDCTELTSIEIPNSVTNIEDYAFSGCTGLTSVTIGNSVTSIGDGAFYGCTGLTSITIPNSVTSIGSWAFEGCSNLIYNQYDNAYYLGNENNPYLVLIKAISNNITSYTINSNTRVIYSDAFYGCTGLTSITIPNSVTSIGTHAFFDCTGLKSITIPDSVTSIGRNAFFGCTGLKNVYYSGTAEQRNHISIGDNNFELTNATWHYLYNPDGCGDNLTWENDDFNEKLNIGYRGSVPFAVSYDKIVVNNGTADFVDSVGSSVISFNAGYSKNQLSTGDGKDIPSNTYDKTNTTTMVITGKIRKGTDVSEDQWNQYKITMTNNPGEGESKLTFRIKNNVSGNWFSKEVDELSDFETFLLNKGYYLKCVKKSTREVATGSHQEEQLVVWPIKKKTVTVIDYTKYIDYYYQVYDANKTGNDDNKNSTAVKDGNGNNLYYCISYSSDDKDEVETFSETTITELINVGGKVADMRLNLEKTTIKSIYSASCPDSPDSMSELLNGSNKFTGYWNFVPWISYRIIESDNISSDETKTEYKNKMDESIYCCERVLKNEYTPKTDDYKTIYYALEKDNKIKLINKNGDWMFSFNASGRTNPLKLTDCVLKDIETTTSDGSNLYYKKGSMPQRQISKIVFENNVAYVYDTSGNKFIRFIYKNKTSEFEADKEAVKIGKYKEYFHFSDKTATVKDEYKGDIYFSCDKFDGPYSITTKNKNNDPIFTSNANNFEIIGAVEGCEISYKCDHLYSSKVVKPTATTQGYTIHTCEICGESYIDGFVHTAEVSALIEKKGDMLKTNYLKTAIQKQKNASPSDSEYNLRLISMIDCLEDYKEVGFYITIAGYNNGENDEPIKYSTDTVYTSFLNGDTKVKARDYGAEYFTIVNMTVPNEYYYSNMKIKPYIIFTDGTEFWGNEITTTVSKYIK